MGTMPKPFEYNGKVYSSQRQAAAEIGVSDTTISRAIKKGGPIVLRPLAPGEKPHHRVRARNLQSCAAHGFCWPSQRVCAAELGVSESFICKLLAEGKFEGYVARRKGVAA